MTTDDRQFVAPPAWADALLRLLLAPASRESVSGDLLEEFRETIVPARGRAAADAWYVKQVAGFLWRACWLPGVLVAAILIVRLLFDAWAPVLYTRGVHPRSAVMTWMLMATFASAACWQTWRTGHARTGVLVALAAAVIGGVLSGAGALLFVAIWHDPSTLRAIQNSGGLDEALWAVPLLLLPIGLMTGAAGALMGKGLTWPLKRSGEHA
jgi:hypothetical protein